MQNVPFTAPTDTDRTISSADVAPVDPAEAAQVHAALSHPYFSNHPTQTAASGVGDIVIGSSAPIKRRGLPRLAVFGLIGLAVVLAISGIILVLSATLGNNSLTAKLTTYRGAVNEVETVFPMTDSNTMPFNLFFSAESYTNFNNAIPEYIALQNQIETLADNDTPDERVRTLQSILNNNIILLQSFLEFYNLTYTALQEKNADYFAKLASNDDPDLSFVGDRLLTYFSENEYWDNYLTQNNCFNPTDDFVQSCELAQAYFIQEQENLQTGTVVVRAIGDAYSDIQPGATVLIDEILSGGVRNE